jgi:putative membrane protein
MLWVKAFHIVFVASWFAGLFYLLRKLIDNRDQHSHRWFRFFNEVPVLLLVAIVVLVVVKPF